MGRCQSAADPADPVGTNDGAEAADYANGQPVSNSARDVWVTETALTTALNLGDMGEMLSIFSTVIGVALLSDGTRLRHPRPSRLPKTDGESLSGSANRQKASKRLVDRPAAGR
jgi:hypothetical protein